jgi:hypothetical protein
MELIKSYGSDRQKDSGGLSLITPEGWTWGIQAFTIIYFALLITSPPISLIHTGDLI